MLTGLLPCRPCRRLALAVVALAWLSTSPAVAAVETFRIDPAHSTVGFTIRHLVSKFTGQFTQFEGTISFDPAEVKRSFVEARILVQSMDTRHEGRDRNLLKTEFFDAARFPEITFRSSSWQEAADGGFAVMGDLSIKGVTKQIVLNVVPLGFTSAADGSAISGWEGTVRINRHEFGVSGPPNLIAEKILGDEVTINLAIEARSLPPARSSEPTESARNQE